MGKVIVISSYVAQGSVGLRAAFAVLTAGGFDVIGMPTAMLSSHLGHAHAAGPHIDVSELHKMAAALDRDGAFAIVDAVLTGYLPTAGHVAFARETILRTRAHSPAALVVVDPVIGDEPGGRYIDRQAAQAIKAQLVPIADALTPNLFELGHLVGDDIADIETATRAARALNRPIVAVTSIPAPLDRISTLLVTPSVARNVVIKRRRSEAHGTGDLFAALFLAALLGDRSPYDAMAGAVAGVATVIDASGASLDLALEAIDWRTHLASQ